MRGPEGVITVVGSPSCPSALAPAWALAPAPPADNPAPALAPPDGDVVVFDGEVVVLPVPVVVLSVPNDPGGRRLGSIVGGDIVPAGG